jgi:phosphate transport system substrate-binding protein
MSPKPWNIFLAAAALVAPGCSPSDTVTVQGCGATFPAPLYKRWFLEFYKLHPDVRVNYQAIGSGAGIEQFGAGLVQFGASDEALKKDTLDSIAKKLTDLERFQVQTIQLPLTAGSVALCYNLPGDLALKLKRKTYVGIFLGAITYWDDPAIQASNPGIALPHMPISCVRRAESSGTTFVFTNHLNAIDPRWTKEQGGPGVGKSVQWPVFKDGKPVTIGGKGNSGVAALIQQTPGAFGYIEYSYAELAKLPIAALENHAGTFTQPGVENCREALEEAQFNEVLAAAVPDPKGQTAYPIVTFTWIVCRKNYLEPRMAGEIKAVLSYCLDSKTAGAGQQLSEQLGYIPLPDGALAKARHRVSEIGSH